MKIIRILIGIVSLLVAAFGMWKLFVWFLGRYTS